MNTFEDASEQGMPSILIAIGVAVVMVGLGGYAAGVMIDQFGHVGAIGLWALGGLGGILYSRLARAPHHPAAAFVLIIACVLAFVFAEVLWIHWNIKDATPISKAVSMFPTFLQEYKTSAFIAAIFVFFGGSSAYGYAR